MSTAVMVPRLKIGTIAESEERSNLAAKAAEILGYKCSTSLYDTLTKLGIAPFTDVGVEKYKASKTKEGMWRSSIVSWRFGLCVPVLIGTALKVSYKYWGDKGPVAPGLVVLTTIVCIILAFVCLINMAVNSFEQGVGTKNYRFIKRWDTVNLEHYTGQVPQFVLAKAIEIKQACPRATFSIDYLETVRETGRKKVVVRRDTDPFLIVHLTHASQPDENYYVEVWDERDYENQMI